MSNKDIEGNHDTTALYDAVANAGLLKSIDLGVWDIWRDCAAGVGGLSEDEVNDLIKDAIEALPIGIDWKEAIDAGDKATKQAAMDYTDSQSMWILAESGNQISNGLASASIYTDDEIKKANKYTTDVAESTLFEANTYTDNRFAAMPLITPNAAVDSIAKRSPAGTLSATPAQEDGNCTTLGQMKVRESDLLTLAKGYSDDLAGQTWRDSRDYTDMLVQNQYAHITVGDKDTLAAAKAYTDTEISHQVDYTNVGDEQTLSNAKSYTDSEVVKASVQSTNLLNETAEAIVEGAKTRWEAADKSVLEATKVAYLKGTLTHVNEATLGPVATVVNDPGTSRTVLKLPQSSTVPDGFTQRVLNITGVLGSSEWASQCRVHLDEEDYTLGYQVHTSKSEISNSFVLDEGGFATVVLDKKAKKWFYLGVGTTPNENKGPTGRLPEGDLPE